MKRRVPRLVSDCWKESLRDLFGGELMNLDKGIARTHRAYRRTKHLHVEFNRGGNHRRLDLACLNIRKQQELQYVADDARDRRELFLRKPESFLWRLNPKRDDP